MKGIPVKVSYLLQLYLGQESANPQDHQAIERHNEVVRQLTARIKALSMVPAGVWRAVLVHRLIDQIHKHCIEKDPEGAKAITCIKGCNHCCHMFVTCTEDEAELLVAVAEKKELQIDIGRLKKQKDLDPDDYWKQSKDVARCVFLGGDGLCQVYEDRPSACRNFMVSTPPKNCEGKFDGKPPEKNTICGVLRPEAEILASAAMTLDKDLGAASGLASKLWKRLGGQDGTMGSNRDGDKARRSVGGTPTTRSL